MFGKGLFCAIAVAAALSSAASLHAQTIIDEWPSVKAPPPPALKPVTADSKTTALLVMDLLKQTCNNERRPRCVAAIPNMAKLIEAARAHNVFIIYTTVPPIPISDTLPALAPKGDEPVVTAWVDKFTLLDKDTGLEKMLKDKGIGSVIMIGTATNGAELFTAAAGSLRGFNVIVPVDGTADASAYDEQAVVRTLSSAPVVSSKVTLTSIGMIQFQ